MRENFAHRTYKNTEGLWDIEIDFEDFPIGNHVQQDIGEWYLFRILGPNNEQFTYEVRYETTALASKSLQLGNKNEPEKKIDIGMEKVRQQVSNGAYLDLLITRKYDGWEVTESPTGLKKHSPPNETQ